MLEFSPPRPTHVACDVAFGGNTHYVMRSACSAVQQFRTRPQWPRWHNSPPSPPHPTAHAQADARSWIRIASLTLRFMQLLAFTVDEHAHLPWYDATIRPAREVAYFPSWCVLIHVACGPGGGVGDRPGTPSHTPSLARSFGRLAAHATTHHHWHCAQAVL